MNPISIYELSFIFSFFSRQYGIRTVNLKHLNLFLDDPKKKEQLTSLFTLKQNDLSTTGNPDNKKVLPWKDISAEEYDFCVSRLAKNMVYKEKIYAVTMLTQLCMKEEENIITLKQCDIIKPSSNVIDISSMNTSSPILSFAYVYEERLFLVKTYVDKGKINGVSIEPDKLYPMKEGDILTVIGKLMSFNEMFHLYYTNSSFPPLYIVATETTPLINFHSIINVLEIKGCSIPENSACFYFPILKWLNNYLLTKPEEVIMNVRLDYFNASSSKFIFEMLIRLKNYKTDEIKLQVNWYYSDEDIEEAGRIYSDIMNIPFSLISQN
jgi:hypothetical protein